MATEHVTRFYSLALGKEKNFNARTDGLISNPLDGTPDVSIYSLLYADTAGNGTISYFDNGAEGQVVVLVNVNSGGISFIGANIYEQSSAPILNNESIAFILHNSSWLELFRSKASAENKDNYYPSTVTWSGSSTGGANVQGLSIISFTSAGEMVLKSLSNGTVGQRLTILNKGGGVLNLLSGSGGSTGTFLHASGVPLVMPVSSSVHTIYDGTNWIIDGTVLGLL